METNKNEVKFFYNKKDLFERNLLAYAHANRIALNDCEVNTYPFTELELLEIADKLDVQIKDLIRNDLKLKKGAEYFDAEDYAKILKQYPDYLRTPIAISSSQSKFVKSERDLWSFDRVKRPEKSKHFNP